MSKGQKDPVNAWPDGCTWVFQGTIAEDATAGTHLCTLTVTPGAASEMQIQGGMISVGNTATAQTPTAFIDDGTNIVQFLLNSDTASTTTANLQFPLPEQSATGATRQSSYIASGLFVSGAMRLILKVSTVAVSVTQTFALVCRLRSPKLPTATLLDTIGTSTNTINTNRIFG